MSGVRQSVVGSFLVHALQFLDYSYLTIRNQPGMILQHSVLHQTYYYDVLTLKINRGTWLGILVHPSLQYVLDNKRPTQSHRD